MDSSDVNLKVVYYSSDLEAASFRYHINSLITIITNGLVVYLILVHSPKQMGFYKYYLLFMILCSFVFDIHFSFIAAPIFLFPYIGICFTGIFTRNWGISGQRIDFVFGHFLMSFCATSLLYGFFYRYYAIIGRLKFWNSFKGMFILFIISLLYPLPTVIFLITIYDPKEEIYRDVRIHYPGIYDMFIRNACDGVILKPLNYIYSIVLILQVFIMSVTSFVLCVKTVLILKKLKISLSSRTYRMHRQLLIAIFFQCCIPLLFLIVPICGIVVLFVAGSDSVKVFSQIAVHVISFHSAANAIMTMLLIPSYRNRLLMIIRWKRRNNTVTSLDKHSSIHQNIISAVQINEFKEVNHLKQVQNKTNVTSTVSKTL